MISNCPNILASWCNGEWNKTPLDKVITGINQDSRNLSSGEIYVALQGKSFDGHNFIGDAFKSNASGAIVKRNCNLDYSYLLKVNDPLIALQDIAYNNRIVWPGFMVGITGSAGKTTLKELCSAILDTQYTIHKTHSNYNNHIGVPLTLIGLKSEHEFAVLELGMSQPGEIKLLAEWCKPDVAIITNIGLAHFGNFNSINDIANEKSSILRVLDNNQTAIIDADSRWYNYLCKSTNANILSTSMKGLGEINGYFESNNYIVVDKQRYKLPQPGEHMAYNVLKAIALAKLLNIETENIQNGLINYNPAPMRWQETIINDVKWINDAYNANPLSMRAALKTFKSIPAKRKWLVLGKMHELGNIEEHEHKLLFDYIDSLEIDGWIIIGSVKNFMNKNNKGIALVDMNSAIDILEKWIRPGDAVLLKGSRNEHLEKIFEFFN